VDFLSANQASQKEYIFIFGINFGQLFMLLLIATFKLGFLSTLAL